MLVLQIESWACQVNATLTGQDRSVLSMIPKGRRAEILVRSFEAFLQYATLGDPPRPSCCGPPLNFLCIASSWTTRVRFKAAAWCESLVYWLATLW